MAHLIDKDAVLAEIERLKKELQDKGKTNNFIAVEIFIMNYFLCFINSLEVKEVDLTKKGIIDKACWWLNNNRLGVIDDDYIKEFRKAINN